MHQDAPILATLTDLQASHCIVEYGLMIAGAPPRTMLIEVCKLSDVFLMVEARRNSEWRKLIARPDINAVTIHVRHMGDKAECESLRGRMLYDLIKAGDTPACNAYGTNMNNRAQAIACSNGETYRTQSDAAERTGVTQSAVSQCCAGKLKSVKGLVFWRVTE